MNTAASGRLELGKEYPAADEAAHIAEIVELFTGMTERKYPPGVRPMRRDAHTKAHGLLKAEFTVLDDLPERAKRGLFKQPATYQALIRFSSAFSSIAKDTEPDVRGMAIKVMGVEGEKLLENEKLEKTQDFLLISTDVFFSPNIREYAAFSREYVKDENPVRYLLQPGRWRQAFILYRASRRVVANPLTTRYWSTVPFAHGSAAVKYSAVPSGDAVHTRLAGSSPNGLREAMAAYLQNREAGFDFKIQFQSDPVKMPVEDPSVSWNENESPFLTVARIRIPPQRFDTPRQDEYAEHLSFTPWHALPEHRPIGGVNRSRKIVYEQISALRHRSNGVPSREPASFDDLPG